MVSECVFCEFSGSAESLARSASHAHYEVATKAQTRLTRLDVLKSLVGHDCGVGEGSQAVRCELSVWEAGVSYGSAACGS